MCYGVYYCRTYYCTKLFGGSPIVTVFVGNWMIGGLHADRNESACDPAARYTPCLPSRPSTSRVTPPIGISAGVPSVSRDPQRRRCRHACARILSFSLLMIASLANVRAFLVPTRAELSAFAAPRRMRGGGPSCSALRVGASALDPLCPLCALASSSGLCSRRSRPALCPEADLL